MLRALVEWTDLSDDEVRARLAELDGETAPSDEATDSVAMRLARRGGGRLVAQRQAPRGNHDEALIDDFLSLDRRRRTLLRMLAADLRLAQARAVSGS